MGKQSPLARSSCHHTNNKNAAFLVLLFQTRVWLTHYKTLNFSNEETVQSVHVYFAAGLHLRPAQAALQKDLNEIETVANKLRDLDAAIGSLDAQSW